MGTVLEHWAFTEWEKIPADVYGLFDPALRDGLFGMDLIQWASTAARRIEVVRGRDLQEQQSWRYWAPALFLITCGSEDPSIVGYLGWSAVLDYFVWPRPEGTARVALASSPMDNREGLASVPPESQWDLRGAWWPQFEHSTWTQRLGRAATLADLWNVRGAQTPIWDPYPALLVLLTLYWPEAVPADQTRQTIRQLDQWIQEVARS